MGKFRETLWFKKGLLDAAQAEHAATSGDGLVPAAFDLLPLEDRYVDDGSVTREDSAQLSLATGGTRRVPTLEVATEAGDGLARIAREMADRRRILAVVGASMAGLVAMLGIYAA